MKMTIYKTYQEAKIANPNCDIYSHNKKFTPSNGNPLHPDVCGLHWTKCDPADHCMSVEEFLNKGFSFKIGDKFLNQWLEVITVANVDTCNIQDEYDENRYVLSAVSLDAHLGVAYSEEWKLGDKCLMAGNEYTFGCINPMCDQGSVVIFDETGDYHGCCINELSRPETPQQREERERLEAAYDLYCECADDPSNVAISFDLFKLSDFVHRSWLRIVDKTGYRKEK